MGDLKLKTWNNNAKTELPDQRQVKYNKIKRDIKN